MLVLNRVQEGTDQAFAVIHGVAFITALSDRSYGAKTTAATSLTGLRLYVVQSDLVERSARCLHGSVQAMITF